MRDRRTWWSFLFISLCGAFAGLAPVGASWAEGDPATAVEEFDPKTFPGFPITNKNVFTFAEVVYSADDELCNRFLVGRADFRLPDWKPARNVLFKFDHYRPDPNPKPMGGWAELDFGTGNPMIALATFFHAGAGQELRVLEIGLTEFQSNVFDRIELITHREFDTIAFYGEQGTSLVKAGRYKLRHADAIRSRRQKFVPGLYYSGGDHVSPVVVGDKVYVAMRPTSFEDLTGDHVAGMLIEYHGHGRVTDLCYFADEGGFKWPSNTVH